MPNTNPLNDLVTRVLAAVNEPADDTPPPPETSFRERFYELIVISLGSLFPKMPASGQIYDRTTLSRIILGMDDSDSANLGRRVDDWLRLEGVIKQEEGKRAYFLPLSSLAALSVTTSGGLLGDVCAAVQKRYNSANPSRNLRIATRDLGAAVIQLLNP